MINQAIHTVDLMSWCCGRPVAITARVERRHLRTIEVEDTAEATIRFAPEHGGAGAVARMRCENDQKSGWKTSFAVRCERGSFAIGDGYRFTALEHPSAALRAELHALDRARIEGLTMPGKECYGDHHALQIADVIGAVSASRAPRVRLRDAATAAHVVLGMYHSTAQGGKEVALPAADFKRPALALAARA
jgi:predicted dehydrogenase